MKDIKHKAIACSIFILISAFLGSIGCLVSGCTHSKIQVIDNVNVVTNTMPVQSFNDQHYVWENFYFSTNQVKQAK